MVIPKRTTTSSALSSQTSYYLLLAVKILFVLLILLLLPQFVTADSARHRRKRTELKLRNLRWACQNEKKCSVLIPQESLNCVNACISPACYEQVYAKEPLEDGEVDFVRAKAFESCAGNELRAIKRRLQRDKI